MPISAKAPGLRPGEMWWQPLAGINNPNRYPPAAVRGLLK